MTVGVTVLVIETVGVTVGVGVRVGDTVCVGDEVTIGVREHTPVHPVLTREHQSQLIGSNPFGQKGHANGPPEHGLHPLATLAIVEA